MGDNPTAQLLKCNQLVGSGVSAYSSRCIWPLREVIMPQKIANGKCLIRDRDGSCREAYHENREDITRKNAFAIVPNTLSYLISPKWPQCQQLLIRSHLIFCIYISCLRSLRIIIIPSTIHIILFDPCYHISMCVSSVTKIKIGSSNDTWQKGRR